MFQFVFPHSPVDQDFVWLAEYQDNEYLSEYDFIADEEGVKKEHAFQEIEKERLVRFGLVGHGNKMFFEANGGIFKINGAMYEVLYKEGEQEFYLTGQNQCYNDIIQYKEAEVLFNPFDPNAEQFKRVAQYNFGYKTELAVHDVNFNFKAICGIPMDGQPFINFWLVSSRELNGRLIMKRNGQVIEEIEAQMEPNKGYELKWYLK